MKCEIANPWYLVLIPILVAAIIYSARYMRIRNKIRKKKYVIIRCLIVTLLVLALSGVHIQWNTKNTTTIFLVDLSDSNRNHMQDMEEYLSRTIEDMPKNNEAGIIVFGGDTQIEQFITEKKIFSELEATPTTTSTNLEKAVSTAMTIFPEDSAKRIVLLTDGLENAGSIQNTAGSLLVQNIDFQAIKLERDASNEIYVSDLTLPDVIHIGDEYAVNVTIQSTLKTTARVSLYSGRTLKGQQEVALSPGENRFVFQDVADTGGLRSYHVTIEAADGQDTISMNNEYCAFTQIETPPKILLVEGTPGQGDELAKVLAAAGVQYDQVTPSGVPTNMADMIQYKCIVTVDVYADDFKNGFLGILESYVRDYAGGLITTGGNNSFALGGYKDTPLETVLPVYMDLRGEKEVPKMAMAMVIDHSGSMTSFDSANSQVTRLDLAKQAAIEGLTSLRATDEVGVMAFDDSYNWVIPIQLADDTDTLETAISEIGYGGGTSIYPAVAEAEAQLEQSDAQIKHIILLTDGQDTFHGYDDVIQRMNDNGITLSAVAVGGEADTNLLQSLSSQCGGRYYYTDINNGIPRIFAQEIFLSVRSYLIQEEFTPIITNQHAILDGVFQEGAPTLLGYVAATPKETATVVLESDQGDPILTTWQYGLGKTIAWNTDATNQWTANWASWQPYVQLWKNMVNYTCSDDDLGGDSFEVRQDGTTATITYQTDTYDQNTKVTVLCTDEDGNTQELTLDPIAPGKYESHIQLEETGVYSLSLKNQSGEEIKRSVISATALQYSPEYRMDLTSDSFTAFMNKISGKYVTYEDSVWSDQLTKVRSNKSITMLLLILALLLFGIDVVTRRLNLSLIERIAGWVTTKFKWKKKKEEKALIKEKVVATKEQAKEQAKEKQKTTSKKERKGKKEQASRKTEQTLDMDTLLQKKHDREW